MKAPRGFKAWLITWEWSGEHAKRPDKVAEILDPRLPPERVRQIVELFYHRDALLSEKISWRLRKQRQPYSAEFVKVEGLPWPGQIHCGHNPWLLARLVDDFQVVRDENGHEKARWKNRYDPRDIRAKIIALKDQGVI